MVIDFMYHRPPSARKARPCLISNNLGPKISKKSTIKGTKNVEIPRKQKASESTVLFVRQNHQLPRATRANAKALPMNQRMLTSAGTLKQLRNLFVVFASEVCTMSLKVATKRK